MKLRVRSIPWSNPLVWALLFIGFLAGCSAFHPNERGLWDLYEQKIKGCRFVDLTHRFEPGIPHWKGFPEETRTILYGYEPGEGTLGSGFLAEVH